MNSSNDPLFASLEMELRSLQPLPPDPEFLGRLERTLNPRQAPASKVIPFLQENRSNLKPWLGVAACAAVAAGAVSWKQNQLNQPPTVVTDLLPTGTAPGASQFVSQGMNSQFHRVNTSGLILDPERGPMRKVRFEFNNSQQFIDPTNGSRLEIHYPTQQEILIIEPMQ